MRPNTFQMVILSAVTVVASATGSCKEYPFEETDPDSNGTLGVMTREPDGPVAAGSLAYFEVHGPSQYHDAKSGGAPAGWRPPATWLKEASAEPVEVLKVEAYFASRDPEGHVYPGWVPVEEVAGVGAEQFSLTDRLLVRAGQAGTGNLWVAASARHNRKFHDVEDIFEISVEPVERLELDMNHSGRDIFVGDEFKIEYRGYNGSRQLHGLGFFEAEVEPEGALLIDDISSSDLVSGEDVVSAPPDAAHVTVVAAQPGTITLRPKPAGSELVIEVIEPAASDE